MFIFKLFRHTGALSRVDTAFSFAFSLKIVCGSKFLSRDIFIYNVRGWCCGGCKCISVDSLCDFQFVALQVENLSWVWSMKTVFTPSRNYWAGKGGHPVPLALLFWL